MRERGKTRKENLPVAKRTSTAAAATMSPVIKNIVALMLVAAIASSATFVLGADEDPLQDFCVRDRSQAPNADYACKPSERVAASDFKYSGLRARGNTANKLGFAATIANAASFAGLNAQGLSLSRLDFAPDGVNPPHIHPRASELILVVQGSLYVGFVSTDNRVFAQVLYPGEIFIFPRGLVHFLRNVGRTPAIAYSALNSQNPGTSQVAKAVFASIPLVDDRVVAKAFQIYSAQQLKNMRELIRRT
ncbi:putative germin-like protein 2-1 [Selaginella moellendorffii]|uniref:putative germin-like protein 2-1 n=1 Tax=Selaginella moellendorffii TaxID=88036 RepID=UPI000D1D0C0E|nr:putative germin-like protein 2-1 [Selaginella moellendorffii]|eukprot:XP_024526186.1 putative germin-like protein 2-1 [Selaginella moellendorffii]